MTAFVLYDYIITTEEEVRLFWGKKLTGATMLFWLNKWLVILHYTVAAVSIVKVSDAVCILSLFLQILSPRL